MKNSIGFHLFIRIFIILVFIALITGAGQICILLLKNTSNNVFTEYIELNAIQDYDSKLNNLVIRLNNYLLDNNESSLKGLNEDIQLCKSSFQNLDKTLTERHDRTLLEKLKYHLQNLENLKSELEKDSNTFIANDSIQKTVIEAADQSRQINQELIEETKVEIDHFIRINKTAVFHSTITIISIGILLLVVSVIGGFLFIKKLTLPISQLLKSTREVREGKLDSYVQINSINEFNELANSFNTMTQTLKKTTISRDYYDSILKNMNEAVLVFDQTGKIETANDSALRLLNYKREDIPGIWITNILTEDLNVFPKKEDKSEISPVETFLKTKDGRTIPVLMTSAALKGKNRFVMVAYDLTEKKEIEKRLEKERKEKLVAINDAHEEEKFRIAADLHDGLGQMLTAISYSLDKFLANLNSSDKKHADSIKKIQHQLDLAIRETRSISHNLIPIVLKDFGLITATQNLIDQANLKSNTNFRFDAYNFDERIDEKLEKAIYRIFQEAINNIIKHSNAKSARLQINKYDDALVIVIEDDGIGFNSEEQNINGSLKGIGLISMNERVSAFNGTITIDSRPDHGTEIMIEIPCTIKQNG